MSFYQSLRFYLPYPVAFFLACGFSLSVAQAWDSQAVANRLSQSFGKSVQVRYDGLVQNAGALTIKSMTISGDALSPDTRLENIVLEDIKDAPRGAYDVAKLQIGSINYLYEGSRIKAEKVTFHHVELPPNQGIYNQNVGYRYKEGQFGRLSLVDSRGKELGRLENGKVNLTYSVRGNPVKFFIAIPKVTVFVSNFPDGSTKQDFIAMGYRQAMGSLRLRGAYGGEQSLMQLDQAQLTLNRGGKLDIALKMDGMTLESLLTVVTLQRENGRGKITSTRMFMGMLGQVQRYNFYSGRLGYEDHGLSNKILQVESKRAGKTPDQLRQEWMHSLPGWLSFAAKTSFAKEATMAMQNFLQNPKNLRLTSKPMGRLSLVMLAISGSFSAEKMVKQLNLSIAANE